MEPEAKIIEATSDPEVTVASMMDEKKKAELTERLNSLKEVLNIVEDRMVDKASRSSMVENKKIFSPSEISYILKTTDQMSSITDRVIASAKPLSKAKGKAIRTSSYKVLERINDVHLEILNSLLIKT